MIALGPRDIAKAAFWAVVSGAIIHIVQQCIAGYVQCAALGCLPNGGL